MARAHYPSLKGLRVFVTGGATGIGAAIVSAFAAQGALVAFADIDADSGVKLAKETGAAFYEVDVVNADTLQNAISAFGAVDILVNNVANDTRHNWRDVTPEGWDKGIAVNLRPAFFAIQACAVGMIERRRGSIVNIGSISWKAKHGGMPVYTTAKSATHGLTRSFVEELGAAGVRINTVLPGWVMTDRQLALHMDAAGAEYLAAHQPLHGKISPEDVASMVLFLGSDDSAMCTGQEFLIDGGWI